MEYWEFLIQREGDRGWRTIETGNLQLMEGKYRIVANSDLLNTQIQIRATYQTADTIPQRRSQSRTQTTNPRGLLAVVPFTQLQPGIWQFVCSSKPDAQVSWQRILKLRVLSRIPQPAPLNSIQPQVESGERVSGFQPMEVSQNRAEYHLGTKVEHKISSQQQPPSNPAQVFPPDEERFDLPTPTKPVIPISTVGAQENWADGLDRLLEQLERESLQTPPPPVRSRIPGSIQLTTIFDSPSQLISLNRSTFSGLLPGHRLTISGTCNLQKLSTNLIQSVKIDKLSICLRHPQTSEIIFAIEQSLPAQLDTFTFSGDLELPMQPQTALLIGEVNLYDKHHIQLGSRGFTVSLSLDPLHESELSLFQASEQQQDSTAELLDRLTAELQLETVTIGTRRPMLHGTPSNIRSLNSPQSPTNTPTHPSAALFTHPDIVPVPSSTSQSSNPHIPSHTVDITGDLEIDFALSSYTHESHNYENLEIVVDE
jgi:hypothetical protein